VKCGPRLTEWGQDDLSVARLSLKLLLRLRDLQGLRQRLSLVVVNALVLPRVVSHLAHVLLKKQLVLGSLPLLLLPLLEDLIELRG
jgi:hypothetical protein